MRLGIILGTLAVVLICGYSFYAILPYLLGPSLEARAITEDGLTTITGNAVRVSYLSINDMSVSLAEDGSFSEKRAYPPGYTAVTISAKDRFGRTIKKTLSFVTK